MNVGWIVFDALTGAERWRAKGTLEASKSQQLDDGLAMIVVPAKALDSTVLNLEAIKASLAAQIDVEAEGVRCRYIPHGAGQMATYLEKEAEARAVIADQAGETPFLDAEANALGMTVASLSLEVIAQADIWRALAPKIEAARRKAKVDLYTAENFAEIASAIHVDWQLTLTSVAD